MYKKCPRKHQSLDGLIQNFCVNKFGVLPLCYPCQLRQLPKYLHEYTFKFGGLFRIKKTSTAIYFCNQCGHREVNWVGLIMLSKQRITVFCQKKKDVIVPPHLCMNQDYISALKSERLPLFLVCIDNIYGLHLKGQTLILSQN